MRRTAEAAARTRASLIEAGTHYFTAHSYSEASLETLAAEMGVTRGAVYHHFGSKRGFFQAIVESVFADLRNRIVAVAESAGDGWAGLRAGCDAFVEAATDETFRRIALIQAPASLGWEVWKAIDEGTTAQSLREGLEELAQAGELTTADVEALSVALSGAMNELSLWIAAQPHPDAALAHARSIVHEILDRYTTQPQLDRAAGPPAGS